MSTALTVLHVDDEDDIREVAAFALELDPGVSLISAASGEAAMSALDGGLRPDVILLDVMMPQLDGPGTLARLRERPDHQQTPVIFMTARAQSGEVEHYRALGALDVIIKPFDPMTLAKDVRAILAARR
jgi:two-component system, OmpR family, response regulator